MKVGADRDEASACRGLRLLVVEDSGRAPSPTGDATRRDGHHAGEAPQEMRHLA
jgi:hypothetical protein